MFIKRAITTEPIAEILATRWSPRAFDPDRPVGQTTMVRLFEAARWAPSCFNEQPWRYLICDRYTDEEAWDKALSCLVEGNQVWAKRAPVLIAAISDSQFSANGKPNRWKAYDTGAASENMCLQACKLGLAIHQMGGFDASLLIERFGIAEQFEPIAMIALGYPGDPDQLSGSAYDSEIGPRSRRPIEEFVFANDWNSPFAINTED